MDAVTTNPSIVDAVTTDATIGGFTAVIEDFHEADGEQTDLERASQGRSLATLTALGRRSPRRTLE